MTFYTDLQAVAQRLISDKGQDATIGHKVTGAYNPATGTQDVTTTTFPAKVALFGIKARDVDGSLILQGDQMALIGAQNLGVVPGKDDVLTITQTGVTHTVIQVEKVSPGGTDVIYKAQVRQT